MRSFSRQLRDLAHRSYEVLRGGTHWSGDACALETNTPLVSMPDSNQPVEVDFSHRAHKLPSETNSATSSSSSSVTDDYPAFESAHEPLEGLAAVNATVPTCPSRRIIDPPPSLDDLSNGLNVRPYSDPSTGLHPLAPPPCHYRRKPVVRDVDSNDDVPSDGVYESSTKFLDEPMRFPF